MKIIILILLFISNFFLSYSQAWFPCDLGTSATVNSMVADTTHNRLFVCGTFTNVDTLTVNHIAIWNGFQWNKFMQVGGANGMANTVSHVFIWNNDLYLVENGSGGQYLYKTTLDSFNLQLMHHFNGGITDIIVYHDTLFVCGDFSGMMSKWDGTNFVSVTANLGTGIGLGLYDMEVYSDKIYVGGNFEITSPYVTKDVAAYNNGVWEDVGTNLVANLGDNGTYVYSVKPYNNKIYISGEFTTANNGSPADGLLVMSSDSSWTDAGVNPSQFGAKAMTLFNNKLFFAGIGSIPMVPFQNCLLVLNDTTWEYGCYNGVGPPGGECFEQFQGNLYLGGSFFILKDSQVYAKNIAYLDLDTVINSARTILNKNNFENISVYPNPANESVTVEWNGIANEIELQDLIGRVVVKQGVLHSERNKQLNIANLKSELYLLIIKNDKGIAVRKIIKQ